MTRETFTIGIEEEYQIVDPQTRELRSYITTMLEEGGRVLGERVKPEMHQSVVEVGTGICNNAKEAREDLGQLRASIARLAQKNGLAIVAASTHPFSDWKAQEITPRDRYHTIVEDLQDVARANLIFGLHVHIGIKDKELAIDIMNQARYFLPHILALSTSSPFWIGRNTGLKSMRSAIFRRFPRTGLPDTFTSYAEFDNYLQTLIKTGSIEDGKKIWWDLRPHTFFSTIEFRIADLPPLLDETIAIAALIQALCFKLYKLRKENMTWRTYSRALVEENKWRAMRYGLDGKLIDYGKSMELPARDLLHELLDFVKDAAMELGSWEEVSYVEQILQHGTGADRQLKTFKETGDLKAVVDQLIRETVQGVDISAGESLVESN